MASPATGPLPPDARPSRWLRGALAVAAALPPALVAFALAAEGWRSAPHGAFLQRVLFALDRGQLEQLGFEYPPLPFLLLLPWPTATWTLLLGALGVAALAWCVLDECTERRSALPLVLLLAILWSPLGVHFTAGDFNEILGLVALYIGWRHYRRWWATRRTAHGLYTGLWLGLAFYTSPLGLALALIAGAILPILFPRLQIPPFASQLVLLVFPGAAATATWAYLSWVFAGRIAFPFHPWEPASPGLVAILTWSAPWVAVALLALLRPTATTAGLLLPLGLLVLADRVGWHFSLAFATTLLTLVAIIALPRDLARPRRWLVAGVAMLQALLAWRYLPLPRPDVEDARDRAVATALGGAPERSVLLDDRWAERMLKWTPSMRPYLTTRETGFDLALSVPALTVRYVLVTPDDDGLTLDADVRPPAGFVVDWSWGDYTLYRRTDAPRLPVRYDALLTTTEGTDR